MNKKSSSLSENIVLQNNNGETLKVQGKLFSESSYFDEENHSITRLRLYASDNGNLVYSIISGDAQEKSRRFYTVNVENDVCTMSDGAQTVSLPLDMLFGAVFGLCGIEPSRAEELRPAFEETLRAANEG